MSLRNSVRNRFTLGNIPIIAILAYGIALISWIAVMTRWLPVPGPSDGMKMSEPGAPEAIALGNGLTGIGLYLLMWGIMMIAMMYPSTVPLFRMYYKTLEGTTRTGKTARVGAFMGTYALVWAVTGVVPLVVNTIVPIAHIASEHGSLLVGGSLLLLSAYQLSSYKYRCLRYCRSPLGFLMSHHQPGIRGAVRMSWEFSVFCIGCCWALFAFMVVVGSMNIVWMALIAVVLSLERLVAWGQRLATGIGVVAGVAGATLIFGTLV